MVYERCGGFGLRERNELIFLTMDDKGGRLDFLQVVEGYCGSLEKVVLQTLGTGACGYEGIEQTFEILGLGGVIQYRCHPSGLFFWSANGGEVE